MKNLIIIGAGGFGLEVAAYAEDMTRHGAAQIVVTGFLDDSKAVGTHHGGCRCWGRRMPRPIHNAFTSSPWGRRNIARYWQKKCRLKARRL